MPRFALIKNGIVENVIEAALEHKQAGYTVVQSEVAGPGDSYSNGTFTPRVPGAAELERRDAPGHLRQALALLAAWQDDALSAAELGALSAAQRIARQAQTETRTAALARIVRRLLITQGLDQ